ncbi:Ankyrin repeats (3 copies) [Halomonas sp. THAF5a]|uniref:ankyrin repeat domain-containing protein n=1 Tax=Halomonas sp. THAF5a TaxID=2587844 RepID=UPI001268090F|nr:ankyrin repeat domain-containing protein [Halomonas sp. THAF5a]QFU00987.1 Ankyrin repeats (3 copies) [Halomonas sp. THAF5a]
MKELIILRAPGEILRSLVTASGYRPFFVDKGLIQDLEDQALEKRGASNFELLQDCQIKWLQAIREDCGANWHDLVDSAWQRHSDFLRSFARDTNTTGMMSEPARDALQRLLVIPEVSGFIRRASVQIPLLDVTTWWEAPFFAWLHAAARYSGVSENQLRERLANHLEIDQRTLERWQHGHPVGKRLWPYRRTAQQMFAGSSLAENQAERLTGWLVMAVAVQSVPIELRRSIKRDFDEHDLSQLKSEKQVRIELKREAADRSSLPLRDQVAPVLAKIQRLFAAPRSNEQSIRQRLDWFRSLYDRGSPAHRVAHEYLWLWLSARLEANVGEEKEALELYDAACEQAWWRAGRHQHSILHEALCHAVGVGDKTRANRYWDKCFLLGLNSPPKRKLDDQEMRRLSFEFERLFPSQKARHRIPPAMRFEVMDKPFSLTSKDLANPNRKRGRAEGRVRFTPLMDAVREGSLEDVKKAVQAGGDPNVFIRESGENALIIALRRARDRKDQDILQYLLTLSVSQATANRPASTKRETPLKIALEMGHAEIVGRLIDLGADVERSCCNSPSALVYAMALLHDSTHASDPAQHIAYLEGRVPAEVFDAKGGAILDCELSALRKARMEKLDEPWKRNVFAAVAQYFSYPVDARRQVIMALLENGADPNRRYAGINSHRYRWTPTLFAAEVGDLEVLKAMLAAGGDPWASLEEDSPSSEKNALWVAVSYQQQAVVEHLLRLLP